RVPIVDALFALVASDRDFSRVDDDDMVAVIHMRRVGGLVLAAQPGRDDRGKTPEHQPVGVDQRPAFLDVGRLGGKSAHVRPFGKVAQYATQPVSVNAKYMR